MQKAVRFVVGARRERTTWGGGPDTLHRWDQQGSRGDEWLEAGREHRLHPGWQSQCTGGLSMDEAQERAESFRREMAEAAGQTGAARRREEVLERATSDERLEREFAEEVYDLALEESVEPRYALALVRSGYVVRELVPPEASEESMQQDAPTWVELGPAKLAAIERERRLRASLRRLRHMLERCGGPVEAADAYLAEPDVEPGEY